MSVLNWLELLVLRLLLGWENLGHLHNRLLLWNSNLRWGATPDLRLLLLLRLRVERGGHTLIVRDAAGLPLFKPLSVSECVKRMVS